MAFAINYGGDDTALLESTLRFVMEQPSDWIVGITATPGEDEGEVVDGIVIALEGGKVTLHEVDDNGNTYGAERVFDLNDIDELEVF